MQTPGWFLSSSAKVRYSTGALAYFAQGIPMGLLHIALPAWLATQGVSASAIATFLGMIMLPWAFKLLAGPLMDHFEYLPMGAKRPWVLASQLGMVVSLAFLGRVDDPVAQIGLLTAIGFAINTFTAMQDVAVDGMSIDLVPVEEEGRLNAFMSFGKTIGWAATSALTGTLLVVYGMGVTAVVCSLITACIFLFLVFVRERHSERLLPWTRGTASPKNAPPPSFRQMFSDLNHVLWTRASLVIMLIMFIDGVVGGYGRALMPIAAVQVFGFTTPQWSDLNAVMGLAGAIAALTLGPVIDRFGAKATKEAMARLGHASPVAALRDRCDEAHEHGARLRDAGFRAGYEVGLRSAATDTDRVIADHRRAADALAESTAAQPAPALPTACAPKICPSLVEKSSFI